MKTEKDRISELVLQVKKGNKKAFDELYKLTSPKAYFVALEFTKNEHDAEDILQESYVNALSKIASLENEEKFQSWINQIVANKSRDYLKKKNPAVFADDCKEMLEALPEEKTEFIPESSIDKKELCETVMEVVDELSEDKRACVMMMYFDQMSVNEISRALEISISAVKNRLYSARHILKQGFERRGITAVYSATPFGLAAWAISQTAEAVSQTFAGSAGAAKILSGITVAGTATAAAASGAAGAGTGIAAKAAAATTLQKIVASVAVVGVVAGSTVGITNVVKNKKQQDDNIPANSYSDTITETTSGIADIVEDPAPVQVVEKDEENPKHETVNIQGTINAPSSDVVYAGTAVIGTNLVVFDKAAKYFYCDFTAENSGYYLLCCNNNEDANIFISTNDLIYSKTWYNNNEKKTLNLISTEYGYPTENYQNYITTFASHPDYLTDYPKTLCYMEKGENFVLASAQKEVTSAEIVIEYCGEEISDVEFLNNSLNNRIVGYNLNAPYVTTYNDSYHINGFDINIKFSSGKELFMGGAELGYYVADGVKEGENTAVFLFPGKNVEKTMVVHSMTDYIQEIEIDKLDEFLKFEINENGFDLNKPEEYNVTVTYGDGTKETFNGADWDKNIVLEDGSVLIVEFTQPKLVDREAVQFIVAVGEQEYIRENARLTGVDPIGFTKKVIVFSSEVIDFYAELIGESYDKLTNETKSFDNFKANLAETGKLTAMNSFYATRRLFGYGLDLFITFIKILSENIIVY